VSGLARIQVFGQVPRVGPATLHRCTLHNECQILSAVMVTGCASVQHLSQQH
jgi:hypothetical protein